MRKINKETFKTIKVGNCSTGTSEGGMVYSSKGVSQTYGWLSRI